MIFFFNLVTDSDTIFSDFFAEFADFFAEFADFFALFPALFAITLDCFALYSAQKDEENHIKFIHFRPIFF